MEVKLNMTERFEILRLLPQQSDLSTIKLIHELKMKLSPSDEEWKNLEMQKVDGQIFWNSEKGKEEISFELGDKTIDIVKDSLKEANKKKIITEQTVTIPEKFNLVL